MTPPQTPADRQPYRQMSGKVIQISRKKNPYADLTPVPDNEAHPPHCRNILFFRYHDADSGGVGKGFTARRYRGRVQVYQDPPATLDWTDVFHVSVPLLAHPKVVLSLIYIASSMLIPSERNRATTRLTFRLRVNFGGVFAWVSKR